MSCSKLFHVRAVTQGDVYRAETDEIPRIFQVGGPCQSLSFILIFISIQPRLDSGVCLCDVAPSLHLFRFCMPTRESAGRRRTWRRSLRGTRPTVSHTKATSSSPHCITSLPTARPAPSPCGTSSSHLRPWNVAAATSSATRTTSTKRRTLLLLAKVKSCSCGASGYHEHVHLISSCIFKEE